MVSYAVQARKATVPLSAMAGCSDVALCAYRSRTINQSAWLTRAVDALSTRLSKGLHSTRVPYHKVQGILKVAHGLQSS